MGRRKKGKKRATGITAQNKDVVSKWFGETMKNRSLSVYGINIPKIVDVRPTNLPAVETNEMRMDNLFLLEDGSYALLDYESNYRVGNKVKYAGYVLRLLRRLQKEGVDISNIQIRIIVIYTADVTRAQTKDALNVGDIVICTTEAFLMEIPSEEVKIRIQQKIEQKLPLDEKDLMELIILPLTYKGKENQQKAAHEAVYLAKEIEDETVQEMALAGILSFSDKIIDKKLANEIRRCLSMTKVGAIIAREMEECEERGEKRGRAEGRKEGRKEARLDAIKTMVELGVTKEQILKKYTVKEYEEAKQNT